MPPASLDLLAPRRCAPVHGWLLTVPLLLMKFLFVMNLNSAAMSCLAWTSGAGSALMIANGYNGVLVVTGDLKPLLVGLLSAVAGRHKDWFLTGTLLPMEVLSSMHLDPAVMSSRAGTSRVGSSLTMSIEATVSVRYLVPPASLDLLAGSSVCWSGHSRTAFAVDKAEVVRRPLASLGRQARTARLGDRFATLVGHGRGRLRHALQRRRLASLVATRALMGALLARPDTSERLWKFPRRAQRRSRSRRTCWCLRSTVRFAPGAHGTDCSSPGHREVPCGEIAMSAPSRSWFAKRQRCRLPQTEQPCGLTVLRPEGSAAEGRSGGGSLRERGPS